MLFQINNIELFRIFCINFKFKITVCKLKEKLHKWPRYDQH